MSRLAIAVALLTSAALAHAGTAHALWLSDAQHAPLMAATPRVAATCVDRDSDAAAMAPHLALALAVEPTALALPVLALAIPTNDDSVPWCLNADDPRCSPIEGGSLPPHVAAQPKLSWAPVLSLPEPRATQLVVPRPHELPLAARDGEHARLERPPR